MSNLKETKGIHINLKAIFKLKEIYPEIRCDIIDNGEYRSNLEELLKKLRLEDNISFLRKLEHEKVIDIMKQYNIVSLLSLKKALELFIMCY